MKITKKVRSLCLFVIFFYSPFTYACIGEIDKDFPHVINCYVSDGLIFHSDDELDKISERAIYILQHTYETIVLEELDENAIVPTHYELQNLEKELLSIKESKELLLAIHKRLRELEAKRPNLARENWFQSRSLLPSAYIIGFTIPLNPGRMSVKTRYLKSLGGNVAIGGSIIPRKILRRIYRPPGNKDLEIKKSTETPVALEDSSKKNKDFEPKVNDVEIDGEKWDDFLKKQYGITRNHPRWRPYIERDLDFNVNLNFAADLVFNKPRKFPIPEKLGKVRGSVTAIWGPNITNDFGIETAGPYVAFPIAYWKSLKNQQPTSKATASGDDKGKTSTSSNSQNNASGVATTQKATTSENKIQKLVSTFWSVSTSIIDFFTERKFLKNKVFTSVATFLMTNFDISTVKIGVSSRYTEKKGALAFIKNGIFGLADGVDTISLAFSFGADTYAEDMKDDEAYGELDKLKGPLRGGIEATFPEPWKALQRIALDSNKIFAAFGLETIAGGKPTPIRKKPTTRKIKTPTNPGLEDGAP